MARPTPDLDLDVDAAVDHLLDQQADIQARLAALLGPRHGCHSRSRSRSPGLSLSLPRELDMLRHKLCVLESVVDRHGMSVYLSVSLHVAQSLTMPRLIAPQLYLSPSLPLASLSLICPLQPPASNTLPTPPHVHGNLLFLHRQVCVLRPKPCVRAYFLHSPPS